MFFATAYPVWDFLHDLESSKVPLRPLPTGTIRPRSSTQAERPGRAPRLSLSLLPPKLICHISAARIHNLFQKTWPHRGRRGQASHQQKDQEGGRRSEQSHEGASRQAGRRSRTRTYCTCMCVSRVRLHVCLCAPKTLCRVEMAKTLELLNASCSETKHRHRVGPPPFQFSLPPPKTRKNSHGGGGWAARRLTDGMAQLCQTGKIQSLDRGLWSTSCPRPKAGRPFLNRKAAPPPPPPA